jgi:ribonuclease HI
LAEHLALWMAMHDADSRLPDKVIFRVDSAAVVGPFRSGHPELIDARRQIDELLRRHRDWQLILVARESNKQARHLAKQPLRKGQ